MASARTRGLLSRSATARPVSTCGGTARAFSASCPAAAASPPATVLTSTTNPIFLRRGTDARREERALGVDRRKLHAIVRILERRRNRAGGFGVVGVLENLNGAQPRGRILVLQAGGDLFEGVLLRGHGRLKASTTYSTTASIRLPTRRLPTRDLSTIQAHRHVTGRRREPAREIRRCESRAPWRSVRACRSPRPCRPRAPLRVRGR